MTIEAVVEKLSVKQAVLREWEQAVGDDRSSLRTRRRFRSREIAGGAPSRARRRNAFLQPRAQDAARRSDPRRAVRDEAVATIFALAKTLGKTPVVVRDAPGFLVNRILAPYLSESVRLLQDGCRIEDVDASMIDFGMPVGPLALLDDVGIDVAIKAGEALPAAFPERRRWRRAWRTAGRLGRKTGRGSTSTRAGRAAARSATRTASESPRRTKSPLPPRSCRPACSCRWSTRRRSVSKDGIVPDPGKLDLAMIFGTGFPPFAGACFATPTIGLGRVVNRLDDLEERLGPRFTPAAPPAPGQRAPGLLSDDRFLQGD